MIFVGQAFQNTVGGTLALPAATQPGDFLLFCCHSGTTATTADPRLTPIWAPTAYLSVYTGHVDAGVAAISWAGGGDPASLRSGACVLVLRGVTLLTSKASPTSGLRSGDTTSVPVLDAPYDLCLAVRYARQGTVAGGPGGDSSGEWVFRAGASDTSAQVHINSWTSPPAADVNPAGTFSGMSGTIGISGEITLGLSAPFPAMDPVVRELNPRMWLDAFHVEGSADGSVVSDWRDIVERATGVVQATPASQPTYRTGRTPNGGPAVDLATVTTARFMTGGDSRSSTEQTVIAVVKRAATIPATTTRVLLGANTGGGFLVQVTDTFRVDLRVQSVAVIGTGTRSVPAGWCILSARLTSGAGGSWSTRIDRAADGSGSTSQVLSPPRTTVLGAVGGASPWDGEIAEVLTWPRALSDAEIVTVEDYLYTKWFAPRDTSLWWWWDGALLQHAPVEGWWDGVVVRPVTVEGWYDGSVVVPL